MTGGITCPECLHDETRVVDSRPSHERGSVWRRRECAACKCRWNTYEIDADRLALLEDLIDPQRGAR